MVEEGIRMAQLVEKGNRTSIGGYVLGAFGNI